MDNFVMNQPIRTDTGVASLCYQAQKSISCVSNKDLPGIALRGDHTQAAVQTVGDGGGVERRG